MRALVLSGGGAKGAYQVGALKHLLGERAEHYDIIAGTSVGALNAAFVSMFSVGNEADASVSLESMWLMLDSSRVWKKWYGGLLGHLPVVMPRWLGGKPSVYSTAPLRALVKKTLKPRAILNSGRKLRVSAVDLGSGDRKIWTEQDTDFLVRGVCASSAFPMFFEPVEIDGHFYTDGGVRESSPISDAIEAGATEIHLIGTGPEGVPGHFSGHGNGLSLGLRALGVMNAEIESWDVKVLDLYNALYNSRSPRAIGKSLVQLKVLRPKEELLFNALDFNPESIRKNINLGLSDARTFDWTFLKVESKSYS